MKLILLASVLYTDTLLKGRFYSFLNPLKMNYNSQNLHFLQKQHDTDYKYRFELQNYDERLQ